MKDEKEKEGEHARYERRVIKMTSDGGATNIVSRIWTHNEEMASKAFGSAPRAERLKMKYNKRINSLLPPLLFHSGRDLQAKL